MDNDDKNYHPEMVILWMAGTVIFWAFVGLCLLGVAGCASVRQPASTIQNVHTEVNLTRTYDNYAARDYRPMEPGESGNCARFAATYKAELAKRGVKSELAVCTLTNGIAHAFTITDDGWVLDNRMRWVGRFEDIGCKTYK